MLFSTPGGGRFFACISLHEIASSVAFNKVAEPPHKKKIPPKQGTSLPQTSVNEAVSRIVGPPAGFSHLPGGALNPPRRLHLPESFLGTLQAFTLPSYATAATPKTGSWRGICKFADASNQNLALVPAILVRRSRACDSNVTLIHLFF